MLVDAVVIARNRAGSHVHARADVSVAEIAKMVCLRPLPQFDLLGLHKIAHVRAFSDLAARTQVRVRTDDRSGTDAGFIQNGAGTDQDTIADFRVLDHAIGANAAVASDPGAAQQLHEGFNDRVGPHLDIRIDDATLRIEDARAGIHEFAAFRHADESVDVHHLGARVTSQNLGWVGSLQSDHLGFCFAKHGGHVREVVLAMRIVGLQVANARVKRLDAKRVEAGVDLANFFLRGSRGLFFDNGFHFIALRALAQHSPIARRIFEFG